MPSLGADMDAGTLVEWLVKPGDRVKRGDIVAVVETQKGAIEIEVFEAGRIEQLLVGVETKVPVGTPLARIQTDIEAAAGAAPGPPAALAATTCASIDGAAALRRSTSARAGASSAYAPARTRCHRPPEAESIGA